MPTQILTTLEYLGTFPDSATTTAHHFGIAVQVAASGATVTASMESLYKPWTWQNPGITIWPVKPDLSLDQPLKLIQIVPSVVTNAGTTTPTGPVDTAILAELNAQYSDAFTHSDFAWTDPQSPTGGATLLADGRRAYPWPAHLAQLSRYPFPIPHLLNLSYIVKVDVSTPVVVSASQSYVAAVGFLTTPSSGVPVVYVPITTGATAVAGRYAISYANQADTIALSTAVTMPATPPGDRFVTPYAEPSDWQANFVAGVADLFDFSARLIRPVRSACDHDAPTSAEGTFKAAIAADFGNYCNAIIYAQRDIVSYGANVGPNGSSLLSRLCDQWINEATSNQPARKLYAKGFTAAVVAAQSNDSDDAWLVFLKQNPELGGNPLIDIPAKASVYDPTAAYAIGTVVVFNGVGYTALKAVAAGTPVMPGSNAAVWSPIRRVTSVAPAHLNDKLLPLEHLQLRFTQNDLLSQLLLARWTAVAPPDPTNQFQSFYRSASNALVTWNLRGILLQGNLSQSWPVIVKPIADKSKLPPAIATEFKNRFTTRFYSVSRPFSQAIAPAFEATDSWLVTQLTLLVPAPNSTATPTQPDALSTRASEGLSLHLDTLAASLSPQQDSADTLRGMIGYCILLRDETSNGPWCCLNLAYPTTSTGTPAAINLTVPVVVPNPQHIQDQMRRSIVTYNSQPLMAQSPTHGFSTDLLQTQADVSGRMISYVHPSVTEGATMDPTYKIPGLVFGHKYRFLIGRVGNSGALPPSFAAIGQPAQISFSTIKSKIPASAGTEVQYLRTVPVADLRFQSSLGSDTNAPQKIKLPAIPSDVQPRARELYPSTASANSPTTDQPVKKTDPLILLTSYMPTVNNPAAFTLYIQKPTVDLLTWDRWRAKDIVQPSTMMDPINIERVAAWDRFHLLARSESTSNALSLDDPAVTQLKVEVDIINADGSPNSNGTNGTPATMTWGTGVIPSTSSNRVQDSAAPIVFTATANNGATSKFNATPTAWDLQLAPGAVARVKFTATVPQGSPGTDLFGKGIYQEKTYTFLVEAANQAMPALSDLKHLFTATPPLTRAGASLDFSLSVDALPTGYQIRRATLQTQVWRWDGRPAGLFPFNKDLVVPDPAILEWEVNAFATRLSTDVDTRPMTLASVLNSSGKPALTLTAHDDLTTELGALYYRSSIEVFNRYGSLVPTSKRSISTFDATQSFPGGNAGWTRTVVKSRIALTPQPPKPAIKFILPLTGTTAAQQSSAASVLVVVQGPWYALSGLAEDMSVRITSAGNNSASPGTLEVGPDPIVWHGNSVPGYLDYPKDPSKPPSEGYIPASGNPRFHGPVGHTFDTSDTNPLWVNTSFVLDAPPTAAGESMPWTFAEVSFCRTILKTGILPDPQGNPTENLQSAWTDPVWVEFLPSRFNALGKDLDLSSCTVQFVGSTVIVAEGDRSTLNLTQSVPDAHMIFVLLLTKEVPDLLGRKGQERYQGAYTIQPDVTLASWTYSGPSLNNPIGRILGIERKFNSNTPPPLINADQLWAELFPATGEAISRIVSISPPIQANNISCVVDNGGAN